MHFSSSNHKEKSSGFSGILRGHSSCCFGGTLRSGQFLRQKRTVRLAHSRPKGKPRWWFGTYTVLLPSMSYQKFQRLSYQKFRLDIGCTSACHIRAPLKQEASSTLSWAVVAFSSSHCHQTHMVLEAGDAKRHVFVELMAWCGPWLWIIGDEPKKLPWGLLSGIGVLSDYVFLLSYLIARQATNLGEVGVKMC